MRTIHVGVGHNHDAVIPELVDFERVFAINGAKAGADGGNHVADFVVVEHLVEARLFNVEQLATDRQDSLKRPVATLFGGATG